MILNNKNMKRLMTTVFMILFTVVSFAQIKPPQQTDTLCISSIKYNYADIRQENWPCNVIYKSTTSFLIGEDEFFIKSARKFGSEIVFIVVDKEEKSSYNLIYEEKYSGEISIEFSGYEFVCSVKKMLSETYLLTEPLPFQALDEKPEFQGGGADSFSKWVNQRLVYPIAAKNKGIQGRVTVQFTVDTDGSVTNVIVIRGVDKSLDKEAVRVVSSSPKWEPGKYRNQVVPVAMTFPVIFQLR